MVFDEEVDNKNKLDEQRRRLQKQMRNSQTRIRCSETGRKRSGRKSY